MNKLERLVLSGIMALGIVGQTHSASVRKDVNGDEWAPVQKHSRHWDYTEKLVNKRTGEEIYLDNSFFEDYDKPNVIRSEENNPKEAARSDLQKVKDGIKKGKREYCEVYPIALQLYVKNKDVKQSKQSSLTKLFKKEKKTVSANEYKNLAVTACNECMKWKKKNDANYTTTVVTEVLGKLDKLNIGSWETYAMLAYCTDNNNTTRYIETSFKKNREKAKQYFLTKFPEWAIQKYKIREF